MLKVLLLIKLPPILETVLSQWFLEFLSWKIPVRCQDLAKSRRVTFLWEVKDFLGPPVAINVVKGVSRIIKCYFNTSFDIFLIRVPSHSATG